MKQIKKLLALVLALAICAAFAVPALAAEGDLTISVNADKAKGHTYSVYQIFTGTVDSSKEILSDVKVGSSLAEFKFTIKDSEGNDKEISAAPGNKVDADVLKAVTALNGEQFAKDLVAGEYGTLGTPFGILEADKWSMAVAPGYYLVIDNNGPEGEELSPYILQVIGNVDIEPKVDQTTLDKEVEQTENVYGEYASKNIGQEFKFKLTAEVKTNEVPKSSEAGSYELKFTDTMSKGLDFIEIDSVKIGESITVDAKTDDAYGYTLSEVTTNDDGTKTFTLDFDLVKAIADNELSGDKIKVVVTYKAKLNADAIVYPGTDEDGGVNLNKAQLEYGANGKTAEDIVYVYTFKIDGTKVDGQDHSTKLSGAVFNLYEAQDDGTRAENATPLTFKNVGGKYTLSTDEGASADVTSGEDGTFNFAGLKAGKYVLVETKAPDKYNLIDKDIPLEIIVNEKDDSFDSVKLPQTPNEDTLLVENNKGSTLPSTGGMGTTILYVVGAVLVVGAGVLLFAKRRTSN